jgi:hypothetical protein
MRHFARVVLGQSGRDIVGNTGVEMLGIEAFKDLSRT